jgi:hypothetical protein
MKHLDIIEKKENKLQFFSTGEIRYIGQILSHNSDHNGYEYTKIWMGDLEKEKINVKVSENGLIFIKFNVEDSDLLKNIEVKHEKCSLDKSEAVLYAGVLTILTKFK